MTEHKKQSGLIEWFEAIVFAFSLLILIFLFCVRIVRVDGSSMVPTLNNGDRLCILSTVGELQQGDVVVIDGYIDYGKPLVKRVIAKGGDEVDIDASAGVVRVNGVELDEPYIAEPTTFAGTMEYPVTVPDGYLFVMGDNRLHSSDSRMKYIGLVSEEDILGKVLFRLFPVSDAGVIQ